MERKTPTNKRKKNIESISSMINNFMILHEKKASAQHTKRIDPNVAKVIEIFNQIDEGINDPNRENFINGGGLVQLLHEAKSALEPEEHPAFFPDKELKDDASTVISNLSDISPLKPLYASRAVEFYTHRDKYVLVMSELHAFKKAQATSKSPNETIEPFDDEACCYNPLKFLFG